MSKAIYKFTSIARPLEPQYRTNLAVLVFIPAGAIAAATLAAVGVGAWSEPVGAAITAALIVFGSWAVTRELAPDDNAAAFASMALAFVANLFFPAASVLPLFAALFLVRVVNRSTGLIATTVDIALVVALTAWTMKQGYSLLGVSAVVAFVADALLDERKTLSWFAGGLVAGMLLYRLATGAVQPVVADIPAGARAALAVIVVSYLASIMLMRKVSSTGDATGAILSTSRVRAGMLVGGLAAAQSLIALAPPAPRPDATLFACLAGVVLAMPFRRRGSPALEHRETEGAENDTQR